MPTLLRRPAASSASNRRPWHSTAEPGIGTLPRCLAIRPPIESTSSSSTCEAEQLVEVVDRVARRDPHLAAVEVLDLDLLRVVLVGDLADDLLEQVLDRDQAGSAAVLVDDDGDVLAPRLHLAHQVVDRLGVRHPERPAA